MTPEIKKFVANLKRIHREHELPVDRKLPDSIKDHPRRQCADCGSAEFADTFTVEDLLGNERVVCPTCWRGLQS